MYKTKEFEELCVIKNMDSRGCAPIPEEGRWVFSKEIKDVSGLSHGVGCCAPQQGACKITVNVKNGIIEECLVETIGCTGMTQSAAMAGEILPGKTLLEALNTDLVCDAINVAMREVFLQLVYGRSQSAFSENGLPIGATKEDLGKTVSSSIGTIVGSKEKGVRYLNTADGYITKLGLDENKEVIGYEFVDTNKMMMLISNNEKAEEALKKCTKQYGRYSESTSFVNPRKE